MATIIPSIINAIQIVIFNIIYSSLAYILTNYENHKTQTSYEQSLILKTFVFQFVNSFNAIIYIAFIKWYNEGCIGTNPETGKKVLSTENLCMPELATQV